MTAPGSQGAWRGEFRACGQRGRVRREADAVLRSVPRRNGKIAEHWEAVETIPPREQRKNDNGKFGFTRKAPEAKSERALRLRTVRRSGIG
jgi:hypothetical protein